MAEYDEEVPDARVAVTVDVTGPTMRTATLTQTGLVGTERLPIGQGEWRNPEAVEFRALIDQNAITAGLQQLELDYRIEYGTDGAQFQETIPLRLRGLAIRRTCSWARQSISVRTAANNPNPTGVRVTGSVMRSVGPLSEETQQAELFSLPTLTQQTRDVPSFAKTLRISANSTGVLLRWIDPVGATLVGSFDLSQDVFRNYPVPEGAWQVEFDNTAATARRLNWGWVVE